MCVAGVPQALFTGWRWKSFGQKSRCAPHHKSMCYPSTRSSTHSLLLCRCPPTSLVDHEEALSLAIHSARIVVCLFHRDHYHSFNRSLPRCLHACFVCRQVGAVLLLRKTSVFTPRMGQHFLNITPRNIVRIFPPDSHGSSRRR